MASVEALAPGSVFAERFRIIDVLGEGEMGTAYVAEALPEKRRCALKVMDGVLLNRDALRARFVAEAKSTSQIASPHLLQTRDAGIDPASARPWFTTDLLPGEDLASRVSRDGARSWEEVRALVDALGDALGEGHALGLIHYDLTPQNVHLGPESAPGIALRELTISRLVADACTAEGNLFGTVLWMPPEQFTLGRPLDPAANTWSLGLLAFYAATGRAYWTRALDVPCPSKALVREILRAPIVDASERARALGWRGTVPAWFDEWFARCVTREADERFPSAGAARAAFAERMGAERRSATAAAGAPSVPPPAPDVASSVPALETAAAAPAATAPSAAKGAARAMDRGRRGARHLALASTAAALLAWLSSDRPWSHREALSAPPSLAAEVAPSASVSTPIPAASSAATPDTSPATSAALPATTPAAGDAPAAPEATTAGRTEGSPVAVRTFPDGDTVGEPTEYDVAAALKALNRVYYGDCTLRSTGKVAITFAPSGRVKKVALLSGDYDAPTVACIAARFGAAKMSPFRGGGQTVTADLEATR
jgi:hypothetical protein